MNTTVDLKQQAAVTSNLLESTFKESNRRDAMSRNQKIMKAIYLSTPNLFTFGMDYLPLQQTLYSAGYRISYSRAKDESKRLKMMQSDFDAVRLFEQTRDETNHISLLCLIDEMMKANVGLPTARKLSKAALTLLAGSSYMRTSNVGMGTRGKTEFQKRVFGSSIRQNLQNAAMNELAAFGFGEIVSTGKDYSKDATGKSISTFRIFRKTELPTNPISSLFEYFSSIKLSFFTPIEDLSTEYKTLLEEYRVLLDIMYPAFQDFQLFNTVRKGEEELKRAAWNEQNPEFALMKKQQDDQQKMKAELEFIKNNELTSYRKAQVKKGYAVVSPQGQYLRPKALDAFTKNEIDNGYKVLDEWANIRDTGKRAQEVQESMANHTPEHDLFYLLDPTVEASESHADNIINSKDTSPRMTLEDMRNYDPEPELKKATTVKEHLDNLKTYAEEKKEYDLRHIADDLPL